MSARGDALAALAGAVTQHPLARMATRKGVEFAVAKVTEEALKRATDLDEGRLPHVDVELDPDKHGLLVTLTWVT